MNADTGLKKNRLHQQHTAEAEERNQDLHGGPGAEGVGDGHAEVFLYQPEAGVVDVGKNGAAGGGGHHQDFGRVAGQAFHDGGDDAGRR